MIELSLSCDCTAEMQPSYSMLVNGTWAGPEPCSMYEINFSYMVSAI